MTTADRLNDLITAKEDMKSAIEEKGVEVTGGLTSYADAIDSIKKIIAVKAFNGCSFGYSNTTWNSTGTQHFQTLPIMHVDLEAVTDATDMFNFSDIKELYLYNTFNVTNMDSMFVTCNDLTAIKGDFNTSNVTNMTNTFYNCPLLSISLIDCGSVDTLKGSWTLAGISGLKDLGKVSNLDIDSGVFAYITDLTSIKNIIDTVYDRATAGYSSITLYVDYDVYNSLSNTYIDKAAAKGWIIQSFIQ